MSNSLVFVDREEISATIEGTDFGGRCYVLARSPKLVLFWRSGHSWSVNGNRSYAEPELVLLPERRRPGGGRLKYVDILQGGRLSAERVEEAWPKLRDYFGDDMIKPYIIDAARKRRTLLIEGGGPRLMPGWKVGREAYEQWRALPEKGLYGNG